MQKAAALDEGQAEVGDGETQASKLPSIAFLILGNPKDPTKSKERRRIKKGSNILPQTHTMREEKEGKGRKERKTTQYPHRTTGEEKK